MAKKNQKNKPLVKKITVSLGNRSYDILIGRGLIADSGPIIKNLHIGRDAVVVTNKNIAGRYSSKIEKSLKKSGMSFKVVLVPDSEKAKSHTVLIELLNRISSYDKNKILYLIALGGGVIGDLTGFAASIYKRGIPYVQIPTTLLAQVDSAIGGKTAIDLSSAKNMIGSFHQPKVVISDTSLLHSLSTRQQRSGLAEIIKYGVIKDTGLFEYLEKNFKKILAADPAALEHVISLSSKIKAEVVKKDEFDKTGKRVILNFGHTIGHAIEAASCYSGKYSHGEAVAIGMIIASRIASKIGILKENARSRIESLIKKCGLPVSIEGLEVSAIYNAHLHDKKFTHGKNRFVLPSGIGRVRVVEDIPDSIIIRTIRDCVK